jgi:hypothetical protein
MPSPRAQRMSTLRYLVWHLTPELILRLLVRWSLTTKRSTHPMEKNAFERGRDSTIAWPMEPVQRKR